MACLRRKFEMIVAAASFTGTILSSPKVRSNQKVKFSRTVLILKKTFTRESNFCSFYVPRIDHKWGNCHCMNMIVWVVLPEKKYPLTEFKGQLSPILIVYLSSTYKASIRPLTPNLLAAYGIIFGIPM